jgi:hypothetical protein
MVLGYEFWMWFTKRAMTNIICLKNIILLYWVTYDSERRVGVYIIMIGMKYRPYLSWTDCNLKVEVDPG